MFKLLAFKMEFQCSNNSWTWKCLLNSYKFNEKEKFEVLFFIINLWPTKLSKFEWNLIKNCLHLFNKKIATESYLENVFSLGHIFSVSFKSLKV